MREKKKIFLIVLAGGNSKRFGSNKLEAGSYPILYRVLDNLSDIEFYRKIVVLGRRSFHLENEVRKREFLVIKSEKSHLGMGYSLAGGVEEIVNNHSIDERFGILFVLADMPYIKKETYKKIVDTFIKEEYDIVVPTYGKRRGNPIILSSKFIPQLLKLNEDKGAREIVMNNVSVCKFLEMNSDEILLDIDVESDLVEE